MMQESSVEPFTPLFRYYVIADGIRELLNRYDRGILKPSAIMAGSRQLALFDP